MPSRRSARLASVAAIAAALAVAAGLATAADAADEPERFASLADLSLEQLRDVVVTTVSRVEERLDRVAASVYVISADDIRRSGATTLPEALRLAPTLDVARADANQYAISGRGFNNVLANKMLVLIDGRTVYTPLFSGVFWEAQDVMLEDVERIEIVTGPSTALWGSNAVNGLIHIITRTAAGTQGLSSSLRAGSQERGTALRYGGALGESAHVRAYLKSYDRSETHRAAGASVNDAGNGVQAGFRADWGRLRDVVTLQGDAYKGRIDQGPGQREVSGSNVTARWQRGFDDGGAASLQVYADHIERRQPDGFAERLDTLDAIAQYGFRPSQRQAMVVGGGLRRSRDRVTTSPAFAFDPAQRSLSWKRLFAQDQIELTPALALTLSASVEGNPYTGSETLPGARLAWVPVPGQLLWAAYSRAVRAPSRVDREFFVPGQPPYAVAGGPGFRSEVSNVIEIGWRAQPSQSLSYSLTLFGAEHRRLRSLMPTAGGLQFENGIRGTTRGLESWARWRVIPRWRLDAGLVLQNQKLQVSPGSVDAGGMASLGNDPHGYATLRSALDLGPAWSWDVDVRRVGARPNPAVPAYTAVDTRVAWKVTSYADLTLGVQNLFDRRHAEWGVAANRVEVERSAFVQLRLRY
ncbi:MAG: TonB-dependent receptor [Caldimonas sp.]